MLRARHQQRRPKQWAEIFWLFRHLYGGVAFDGEGHLVVADTCNHRIQVLRYSDGAHLHTSSTFDGAGHNIVSESGGHRVQVLRYSDGAHVRTIGSNGSGNGQFSQPFGGIAIDSDGRVRG